jgi:uncharacterized protein YkwD
MLKTSQLFHRISLSFFTICLLLFLASFVSAPGGLTDDVLRYTNQFRKSKGISALIMRDELNAIARKHSEDMAKGRCSFGHSGYEKREIQVRRIFQSGSMAENVAYGPSTGKEVVSLWKNSSGHRRNMLGNYKYIGIGTARDRHGIVYYTQIFVR